jgi:hypothetical protein
VLSDIALSELCDTFIVIIMGRDFVYREIVGVVISRCPYLACPRSSCSFGNMSDAEDFKMESLNPYGLLQYRREGGEQRQCFDGLASKANTLRAVPPNPGW